MIRLLLTLACVSTLVAWQPDLAVAPAHGRQDAPPTDQAELQGVWRGFAVEGKGQNPNDGPVKIELVINGDTITATDLRAAKSLGAGTFRLNPQGKIKEIDAVGKLMNRGADRKYPGIYDLQGDTLRWCVDNRGKERPTEFATRMGCYLLILKRHKS